MEGVEVQNRVGFIRLFGVYIPLDPKEINQSSNNVVTDIRTNNGSTSSAVVSPERLPSSAVVPDIRTNGHKRQHSSSGGLSDILNYYKRLHILSAGVSDIRTIGSGTQHSLSAGVPDIHTHGSGSGTQHSSSAGVPDISTHGSGSGTQHSSSAGVPDIHTNGSGSGTQHSSPAGVPDICTHGSGSGAQHSSSAGVPDISTNGSGSGTQHSSSAGVPDISTNGSGSGTQHSSSAGVPDISTNGSGSGTQHSSSAGVLVIRTNGSGRQSSSSARPKKERRKPRFSSDELTNIGNKLGGFPSEITQTIIARLQIQPNEMKTPKLLMVKILSGTDMKASQSRLLIPRKIIKDNLNFVNEKEQKILHEKGERVEVNVFYKNGEGEIVNVMSKIARWPKAQTANEETVEGNATKVETVEGNATKVETVKENATKVETVVEENATKVETVVEENATATGVESEENSTEEDSVEENATKVESVKENATEVESVKKDPIDKWNYALQKPWIQIMKASKLKVEDVVQLWWFRYGDRDEKLGLVLLKVDV